MSHPPTGAETPLARRVIFAMGGGGFTMEPSNPLLDDYVLTLGVERVRASPGGGLHAHEPRILFLPTASGDTNAQINAFHARFADRHCVAEHLSLFRLRDLRRSLAETVLSQDILYVGGGSMRNLLAIWRAHNLDRLLIRAWREGIVLAGISAGAMCWFQGGITRSSGPPEPLAGLGLLAGSLTVHADGEPERLPVWLAAVREGRLPGGWSLDDGVGLLFRGEQMKRVVSSRPGASAQRVDAIAGELVRHRLTPELLGAPVAGGPLATIDDDVRELRAVHRMRRGIAREPGS
ncbi:MAG TPA: peptidase E [Solirubrobacteraceae bacterium]|nr:peptidase E [Solirubrobacteraceae bacterium]